MDQQYLTYFGDAAAQRERIETSDHWLSAFARDQMDYERAPGVWLNGVEYRI